MKNKIKDMIDEGIVMRKKLRVLEDEEDNK